MLKNPGKWREFEKRAREEALSALSPEEAFRWFDEAHQEACSLSPETFVISDDAASLLADPHLRLLIEMRKIFSRVR